MDIIAALILGLTQGITEWLPVSSTGHLVLLQGAMQIPAAESVLFDIFLHIATLFSVMIFLRKDLIKIIGSMFRKGDSLDSDGLKSRRIGWLAILATIPAVIAGLILSNYLEEVFTPMATAIALLFTGAMLWIAEMPKLRKEKKEIGTKDALIIGCFQAVAVVPGISRSGSTISAGCYLGFQRQIVAIFSFLLSIPIIIAALAYNATSIGGAKMDWIATSAAAILAFVTGLLALKLLFGMIQKFKLRIFSIYCWAIGILVIGILLYQALS